MLARHWTEAGEIEPRSLNGPVLAKSAESRNAFKEALESYQQGGSVDHLVARICLSVTFAN